MKNPRFSITLSVAGSNLTPEEAVLFVKSCGWDHVHLSTENGRPLMARGPQGWKDFAKFCAGEGVTLEQCHLINGIDLARKDDAQRQQDIDNVKRWCDMYETMGFKAGAVHPGLWEATFGDVPVDEAIGRLNDSLRQLGEYTRGYEFKVCLENCPDSVPNKERILQMVNPAGCPNIGFCLDTGHLNLTQENQSDYIHAVGDRLWTLHIDDNSGLHAESRPYQQGYWYADDLHLFPNFFKGSVDWKAVLKALDEVGYDRAYNFEVSLRSCSPEYRRVALTSMRQMMAEIFTADGWWKQED